MLYWSNMRSAPSPERASAWRARPSRYACRRRKSTRSSKSTCVWPGAWSGRSQRWRGSTSSGITGRGLGASCFRAMGVSAGRYFPSACVRIPAHGPRTPTPQSDHAREPTLLGGRAGRQAHDPQVPRLREALHVPARRVSVLRLARHRLGAGDRPRPALLLRDRPPDLKQGVQGEDARRARHGRAGRGSASPDQPGRHRAGPEADPLRHARGGLLREAHRRGQPADVPARHGRYAMSDLARIRELSNSVCIVGVDESDEIGTLPGKSQLTLHIEAITNAARDAGLKVSDIDGIFTAGQHSPATIGEAIGVVPRYVDGTTVGGCSFIIMVGHAVLALHHGLCEVAVVCHGESGRSGVGVSPRRDTALSGQFEFPYGFGGAPTYFGLITTRHMHEHVMLTQMRNLTFSEATRVSGEKAFAMAGVKGTDFDHIMLYDAFTSGPPLMLESLGIAKRGEGVHHFAEGRSTPGGKLPINTNGGGLSYTHSGMYGIFPIIEAARQLRGESGARQVPKAKLSLVNGMGGMLSAAGTLVLSNER